MTLVFSDLHYEKDFHHGVWEGAAQKWMLEVIGRHENVSDLMICGDAGCGWDKEEWETILGQTKTHAIYGNHDDVRTLRTLRNTDRSKVWANDAETRMIDGRKFGFINGIIATSEKAKRKNQGFFKNYKGHQTEIGWVPRKMPEEYLAAADILAQQKIDVLITHASPRVPEDGMKFHDSVEFQIVEQAINKIRPKIAFNGHLSGPYQVSQIGETKMIMIDSSPREQCYVLLSDKIRVYHNFDLVKEIGCL